MSDLHSLRFRLFPEDAFSQPQERVLEQNLQRHMIRGGEMADEDTALLSASTYSLRRGVFVMEGPRGEDQGKEIAFSTSGAVLGLIADIRDVCREFAPELHWEREDTERSVAPAGGAQNLRLYMQANGRNLSEIFTWCGYGKRFRRGTYQRQRAITTEMRLAYHTKMLEYAKQLGGELAVALAGHVSAMRINLSRVLEAAEAGQQTSAFALIRIPKEASEADLRITVTDANGQPMIMNVYINGTRLTCRQGDLVMDYSSASGRQLDFSRTPLPEDVSIAVETDWIVVQAQDASNPLRAAPNALQALNCESASATTDSDSWDGDSAEE